MDTPSSKSDFVHLNGIRLHYLDWSGEGPVLLFLAGMGCSACIYKSFVMPHRLADGEPACSTILALLWVQDRGIPFGSKAGTSDCMGEIKEKACRRLLIRFQKSIS